MHERGSLAGRGIVVTRPAQQAQSLMDALRARQARPIFFPVLDIAPVDDTSPLLQLQERLASYDVFFFVSPNAVEHAMAVIDQRWWPRSALFATVGPSSVRALQERGFADVLCPQDRFDSEAVLDLPEFAEPAIAGKRVLILRGDGGRDLLLNTLCARGATVDCAAAYQRRKAASDPQSLIAQCQAGQIDALSFTSSEGARYFAEILGERRAMLLSLPCFVPHARIAEQLTVLGAQQIVLTEVGDAGLVTALARHFG